MDTLYILCGLITGLGWILFYTEKFPENKIVFIVFIFAHIFVIYYGCVYGPVPDIDEPEPYYGRPM